MGESLRAAYGAADYQHIRPRIETALAGQKVELEGVVVVREETRYVHTVYLPDQDLSGAVNGVYFMAFVITARKISEMRQAQSEERLRMIADNLPVLIAYVDRDMRYRFANRRYKAWFGVAPEQMLGKTIAEALGTYFFEQRQPSALRCAA